MEAIVIFSVGVKHPLYNKQVKAEIEFVGGYDGKQVHAHTVELVHYPEDPEGYLNYHNGHFVGYSTKPAYDETYSGYCAVVE